MYRIRSASGNEVSYNSLEEFSAAVRRGEVHPEDEIFHTRANRWLDVKSHPHYRSANTWQNHEPAAATGPRAPSAGTAALPSRPASAPAASASRAQVFERPVVRTAPQTTVRPQLQPVTPEPPAARAEAAAPPAKPEVEEQKPRKSKELAFIDVGDVPGTKPLPSMAESHPEPHQPEMKPAPVPIAQASVAPPAPPKVAPTPTPVVPAVVAPPAPTPPVAAAPAPAPVAQAPVAPVAPPAPPAAPAATVPATEVEFLVMDGGIESPVRNSAGYKTVAEDLGLLFDAPLQNQSDGPPRATAVAGAPPKGAPRNPKPADPAPHASPSHSDVDLEIPPVSMIEDSPVVQLEPAPPKSSSNAMLFGGGAAIVLVAAGLLAWRPWKGGSPPAEPTPAVASAPAATASPAPPLVGAPAPTPIRTQSGATVPQAGKGNGKPTDSALATDTAGDDEILAVSKPSFRADLAVPAPTDFNLGAQTGGVITTAPSELVRRLVAAERVAQQELNNRLASAGFRNVLSSEHLSSTSGVGAARSAWSAGADAIRQYRGRIARLESAYEDSVLSSQRAKRWSGEEMRAWATRSSLAEPTEISQLADLMFSQVNEGLEILAALSGEYSVKGQVIAFKNTASATRYTSIRGWVEQRTSSWAGTPESARPYSVTAILHALGDGFPAAQ